MKTKPVIKRYKFTSIVLTEDSTWINHVQFDPESLKLDVVTRTGAKYRYQGVGTDTFAKLVCAESSGTYFNEQIKGKFRCKKLRSYSKI